jgi:DNA polymerase-4
MDLILFCCERLNNSQLEGIPLIIGGGDRGVVASCSYEASVLEYVQQCLPRWHSNFVRKPRSSKVIWSATSIVTHTEVIQENHPLPKSKYR